MTIMLSVVLGSGKNILLVDAFDYILCPTLSAFSQTEWEKAIKSGDYTYVEQEMRVPLEYLQQAGSRIEMMLQLIEPVNDQINKWLDSHDDKDHDRMLYIQSVMLPIVTKVDTRSPIKQTLQWLDQVQGNKTPTHTYARNYLTIAGSTLRRIDGQLRVLEKRLNLVPQITLTTPFDYLHPGIDMSEIRYVSADLGEFLQTWKQAAKV